MTPSTSRRVAFAAAVVVHLVVLYLPRVPSVGGGFPLDKVAHVLIFALVAWTGLRAGLPRGPLVAVLLAHAVVSEAVQYSLLPGRRFDVADIVADVSGVLVVLAFTRPRRRTGDPADHQDPADATAAPRR